MKDLKDYSLLKHNTFGIEARCSRFLEYSTLEEAQQVAQILRACMEQVFPLKVPLVAEVKTGESWYETK